MGFNTLVSGNQQDKAALRRDARTVTSFVGVLVHSYKSSTEW